MQDHEAGQQLLRGLSSTCEELSTSTSRRDQELQSLSELLQSIKQLQDQTNGVSRQGTSKCADCTCTKRAEQHHGVQMHLSKTEDAEAEDAP